MTKSEYRYQYSFRIKKTDGKLKVTNYKAYIEGSKSNFPVKVAEPSASVVKNCEGLVRLLHTDELDITIKAK